MSESMYIGATGMHAQQTNLDTIANNLANVNTPGFKKSRVSFEDLMYRSVANQALSNRLSKHLVHGVGSGVSGTTKIFTQGQLKPTGNSLDVAISGKGFYEVVMPDGTLGYTRAGSFKIGENGTLTTSSGYPLGNSITVPGDAKDIIFKSDGTVMVSLPNEAKPVEIGKLQLAYFVNPEGLKPVGGNIYTPTQDSGQVFYGTPSKDGVGQLVQKSVESSNVQITEELVNLIMAQRAYEINAKVIQASDEMQAMVNNLRR